MIHNQFEPQRGDVKVENNLVYQYDILGDDYDTEAWCVLCPVCDFASLYPELAGAGWYENGRYVTHGMKVCTAVAESLNNDKGSKKKIMSESMTAMIEALDAAESILRYVSNISTNCNGTKPPMTTHKALRLVRQALKQAEMQRSSHVES